MWAHRLAQHTGSKTIARVIKKMYIDPHIESLSRDHVDEEIQGYVMDRIPDLLIRMNHL